MASGSTSSLQVPRRRGPVRHRKLWTIAAIVGVLALVIGWAVWYLRTPDDLPTSSRRLDGSAVVGQPLYVAMFTAGQGFDRSIEITDVVVDVDSGTEAEVIPRLCRGGSPPVTTDVSAWCPDLSEIVGADLDIGDSIVLMVTVDEPADVTLGRLQLSFKEGLRSGSEEAGVAGASLSFAENDPGVPPPPEPDDGTMGSDRPGGQDKERDRKKDKGRSAGA